MAIRDFRIGNARTGNLEIRFAHRLVDYLLAKHKSIYWPDICYLPPPSVHLLNYRSVAVQFRFFHKLGSFTNGYNLRASWLFMGLPFHPDGFSNSRNLAIEIGKQCRRLVDAEQFVRNIRARHNDSGGLVWVTAIKLYLHRTKGRR